MLYNSGYATFANDSLPKENGRIYAVLGKYSGTYQLLIRSTKDVKFTNSRKFFGISKDLKMVIYIQVDGQIILLKALLGQLEQLVENMHNAIATINQLQNHGTFLQN